MGKKKGLKGIEIVPVNTAESNAPQQTVDDNATISRLETVAFRLENAVNKIATLEQSGQPSEPVKATLDEASIQLVAEKCGTAASGQTRTMLEERQRKIDEHNKEKGYYSVGDVLAKHYEDYNTLVEYLKGDGRRIRSWQRNEVAVLLRWGKAGIAELKEMIYKLTGKTTIEKPKRPSCGDFFDMQRYYFVQLPFYWLKVFFFDPHTKNYFRILIASCWMMTLGLIYFMAQHEAKLELEAEKYKIIRLWSYIEDDTDNKSRVRMLDGLFEDEQNNRPEINALVRELHNTYETQQRKKGK